MGGGEHMTKKRKGQSTARFLESKDLSGIFGIEIAETGPKGRKKGKRKWGTRNTPIFLSEYRGLI